jgi:hypothetical protein
VELCDFGQEAGGPTVIVVSVIGLADDSVPWSVNGNRWLVLPVSFRRPFRNTALSVSACFSRSWLETMLVADNRHAFAYKEGSHNRRETVAGSSFSLLAWPWNSTPGAGLVSRERPYREV